MRALHLVAVLEVAAGAALLGAHGAGDVPSFLLVCGAVTAVMAVVLRRFGRPTPPAQGGGGAPVPIEPPRPRTPEPV
jgi:hypothetical protein